MALKLLATLTLALLMLVNEGVSHSSIIMPSRTKVTPTTSIYLSCRKVHKTVLV